MRTFYLGLFLLTIIAGCTKKPKEETSANTTAPIANDLPRFQVRLLDGTILEGKQLQTPAVLVLFQPDCDHCQREAQQIEKNLSAFRNYTLYFVSSAPESQIQQFQSNYKLTRENIFFGWTTTENILNTFGPIDAPSIYIYSRAGKLVQEFNGEVAIEVVLKYL